MIGLDTNVLIRYILRDDEVQAQQAKTIIENSSAILISLLTLQECEWVLRSVAKRSKLEIIGLFKALLETYNVTVQAEEVLEEALLMFENSKADFSDCLMTAQYLQLGCQHMATFDEKAAKITGVLLIM